MWQWGVWRLAAGRSPTCVPKCPPGLEQLNGRCPGGGTPGPARCLGGERTHPCSGDLCAPGFTMTSAVHPNTCSSVSELEGEEAHHRP